MENSLKAILIGAGVVITLIVVSIGFLLMRSGQNTAQTAIGKLGQISGEMSESQYTMYDGMESDGSMVANTLKKFKDEYIGIQVKTKKNTSGTWYAYNVTISNGIGTIGTKSGKKISDAMDESHNDYINPNGKFVGELIRDERNCRTLIFTQNKNGVTN